MEAAKAKDWAVEPQEKIILMNFLSKFDIQSNNSKTLPHIFKIFATGTSPEPVQSSASKLIPPYLSELILILFSHLQKSPTRLTP
jgi:hypothetical protein